MEPALDLTIVMPCLNEAETLVACIEKARHGIEAAGVTGEVLIADNGSTDGSIELAEKHGARVVRVSEKGYGNALRGGIAASRGRWLLMGDADDSYDFSQAPRFLEKLRAGDDLVMGCRMPRGGGTIMPGAMPWKNRWIGNPVLTFIGKLFFRTPVQDFHCGLRAFSRAAYDRMQLQTTGMEFASEMVVKASLYGLKITEVPTTLSPDGRSRPPHLKTWRDGWRHLRFLLMYSPRWLFLYPGLALMFLGFVATIWFVPQPRVHTLLYSATALIIGFQIVSFAIFTKAFAISEGLLPEDRKLRRFLRYINLEVGLIIGVILFLLGMGGSVYALYIWNDRLYGALDPAVTMRIVIHSVTALALGVQVIFSSFFLSVLGLKRK